MVGTGEIVEGGEGLLGAQVDDQEVREGGFAGCAPVGGFLEVEDLVAGEVATMDFFAVSIFYRPRFTTETIAFGITEVEFGYGHIVFAIVGGEDLKGDIAAFPGGGKADGLPTVARGELAFGYRGSGVLGRAKRRGRAQVRAVGWVVVESGFFGI